MILNACGVVLGRRDWGEADSLATLYTESLGKLAVRFAGVKKPGRKLKALCEPMTWGEYRLYLSPRSEMAKAVGGRILSSFPGIRSDLSRTMSALSCLEFLAQLAPERSPNAGKYRLLVRALSALEASPSPWLETAYALRLLELSGYSLRGRAPEGGRFWEALHSLDLGELSGLPWNDQARLYQSLAQRHAEEQASRPFKAAAFRERLRSWAREALPAVGQEGACR